MLLRFKRLVKDLLPYGVRQRLDARKQGLGLKVCPVCQNRVTRFERLDDAYLAQCDEHQVPWSFFTLETLNLREYSCPQCGSSDRVRLYGLYLRQLLAGEGMRTEFRVLDIAPDRPLAALLKAYPFVRYRSADLFNPLADDRVDVMEMGIYADGSFDFVMCSHVLEHVSDDRRALHEIRRVMKQGAKAILMVPVDLARQTIDEDPSITDEGTRWRRFGQGDHVRAYSKEGYVNRLSEAGFRVERLGQAFFGEVTFKRHGIHPRSILYVVEKT